MLSHARTLLLFALTLVAVACSSDDDVGTTLPPGFQSFTWDPASGASFEGLRVEAVGHGMAPGVALRAEWSDGTSTFPNEVAQAISDDELVLIVPDLPFGPYTVELFLGAARVASGAVEHAGIAFVGSHGGGAIDYQDLLLGSAGVYSTDLRNRVQIGELPGEYSLMVDTLRNEQFAAVTALAGASDDEIQRAVWFWAANGDGRGLLEELNSARRTPDLSACATRIDTNELSRLSATTDRASAAIATFLAGRRFLEGSSGWSATYVRAYAATLGAASFDVLHDATVVPVVSLQSEPRLCTTLTGRPAVRNGTPFRGTLLGDYRSLEGEDLTSSFPVRQALAAAVDATVPYVAAGRPQLAAMLSLPLGATPPASLLVTTSPVSERIIAPVRFGNVSASSSSGNNVQVTHSSANAAELLWTIQSATEGDVVTLTYDVMQDGLADPTTHSFEVSAAGATLTIVPPNDRPNFGSGVMSDDASVVAGVISSSTAGELAVRWTALGGVQRISVAPRLSVDVSAISGDGTTIVGQRPAGGLGAQAFRWTLEGGTETLFDFDGQPLDEAIDVSADGLSVVVRNGTDTKIWFNGNIGPTIPPLANQFGLVAGAISRDGSTVVGTSGARLFRYRFPIMEDLGAVTTAASAEVFDVSDDGTRILGENVFGPFIWSEGVGTQELGLAPGTGATKLVSFDATGQIAVGSSQVGNEFRTTLWEVLEGYIPIAPPPPANNWRALAITPGGLMVLGTEGNVDGTVGTLRGLLDY